MKPLFVTREERRTIRAEAHDNQSPLPDADVVVLGQLVTVSAWQGRPMVTTGLTSRSAWRELFADGIPDRVDYFDWAITRHKFPNDVTGWRTMPPSHIGVSKGTCLTSPDVPLERTEVVTLDRPAIEREISEEPVRNDSAMQSLDMLIAAIHNEEVFWRGPLGANHMPNREAT